MKMHIEQEDDSMVKFFWVMLVVFLVGLLFLFIVIKIEGEENRVTFSVWVKLTGNTNNLSFNEWLHLRKHGIKF